MAKVQLVVDLMSVSVEVEEGVLEKANAGDMEATQIIRDAMQEALYKSNGPFMEHVEEL